LLRSALTDHENRIVCLQLDDGAVAATNVAVLVGLDLETQSRQTAVALNAAPKDVMRGGIGEDFPVENLSRLVVVELQSGPARGGLCSVGNRQLIVRVDRPREAQDRQLAGQEAALRLRRRSETTDGEVLE